MLKMKIRRASFKKNIGLIVQFCILGLFVLGLTNGNVTIINISSMISILYFVFFDFENCIYFLLSLTIFENSFTFFDIRSTLFLTLIFSARVLWKKSMKLSSGLICSSVILVAIEVLRNISNVSIGMVFNNVNLIILFIVLAAYGGNIEFSIRKAILSFGMSILLSVIFVIDYYGGLRVYLNTFISAGNSLRFGGEVGKEIGGAMAIPIYALLQISMTICYLIKEQYISIFEKVIESILVAICMIYGALTISRSFYLGIIIFIILLTLFLRKNILGKTLTILLVSIAIIYVIYQIKPEVFNSVIEGLFDRIGRDDTRTGNRILIWKSAFECLQNSALGILFGYGGHYTSAEFLINNYSWLQAGLHNLYLDVIMSWGIIGITAIIYVSYIMWKKIKENKKIELFTYIPLLVLLYFSATALRVTSLKPYVYFYITIYFAMKLSEERKELHDT